MKREFDRITYSIPSRTFFIESYISKDERLPIVTEFAVRIIRVVREMPIIALRTYLGLSEQETAILLADLEQQRLITISDDAVALTSYAISHFEESSDELPRFSSIEKRPDRVDFELLTFCPVNGRDAPKHPGRTIVLESMDGAALAQSNRRAEAGYQQHFDRILQMKGIRDRKRIDLYKVTSVEADKNFYIPVPISFQLDDHGVYSRNAPDLGPDAPSDSIDKLDGLISDSLQGRGDAALRDLSQQFAEYFGDKVLLQFHARLGFQWTAFLAAVYDAPVSLYPDGTYPVLGNLYVDRNRTLVAQEIRDVLSATGGGDHCTNAFWMAPDLRLWGRTADVKTTFEAFGRAIGRAPALHSVLPRSNVQSGASPNLTFTPRTLYYAPANMWKGRLELLLLPPFLAVCLIHVPLPDAPGVSVPIGFVTRDPRLVEMTRQLLIENVCGAAFVAPSTQKGKTPRLQLTEEVYECLKYVPIVAGPGGFQALSTRAALK